MRYYCTLFDSKYLPQGLALYESLVQHSSRQVRLYVFAMDKDCQQALRQLVLPQMSIVNEDWFRLPEARANRTWQEYCWTMASNFTRFAMAANGLMELTYLDADMLFFSDPEVIFKEIGDKSIAIIPHRFVVKDRQRLERNGLYNVCWNTFKNDGPGWACLSKWASQCRDWCYYRNEDGKFGDQAYLDSWPAEYGSDLCIIKNIGAGLAPWNLAQYNLAAGPKVDGVPVVFFHAHEYIHDVRLTNYPLRQVDLDLIYNPYIQAINSAKGLLAQVSK